MNYSFPDNRHDLGRFLNQHNLIGEGCEIGVLRGSFSQIILDSWMGRILHLVDPFMKQPSDVYKESTNDTEDWNANFLEVQQRVSASGGRAVLHRKLSEDAVLDFKDGQLDWIFIDGNHDYDHVKSDLNNWWPKIKHGGLMCGHDYGPIVDGNPCEVKMAVDEFVLEFGLTIAGVTPCESFYIWKP